jgi:hypothetical protein
MMMDLTYAPESARRVIDWLEDNEFEPSGRQSNGPYFQVAVATLGILRVEINVDRGDWAFALGVYRMGDVYSPSAWQAWAEGKTAMKTRLDPDEEASFIIERWPTIAHRATSDPHAEHAINLIGVRWVHDQIGWQPPGTPL